MPWCASCDRYWTPNAATETGACPDCGAEIEGARLVTDPEAAATTPAGADAEKVPWHFWLLVGSVSAYLGWRVIQGLAWVVERL